MYIPMISLEDCADAHQKALFAEEANGKRLVLAENAYTLK